jgi:biopolymer transport protein ExbD
MAGGGSLGGGGGKQKRGKNSKRKKTKRTGFVLDMTPLVDITFLLLTFFMFTTTMATPQVMEMSVPPETKPVDIPKSKLLSIFVNDSGNVYYFKADEKAQKIEIKEIADLAKRENLKPRTDGKNDKNDLITVLKISENAPYKTAITILDQLNVAELGITEQLAKEKDATGQPTKRKRKFTLAKMEENDFKKLEQDLGGN